MGDQFYMSLNIFVGYTQDQIPIFCVLIKKKLKIKKKSYHLNYLKLIKNRSAKLIRPFLIVIMIISY